MNEIINELNKKLEHNDMIIKDLLKENTELSEKNIELENRIEKANNELITLIQIIGEQPSNNVDEDNYVLSRLESISSILKGDSNE